jgi:hypothetical protein
MEKLIKEVLSAKETTYRVYINKVYFPKDIWLDLLIHGDEFDSVKVKATSRIDAAKKAWDLKGKMWLKKMNPKSTSVRRISLNVNDPFSTGKVPASRLPVIEVFRD